MNHALPNHRSRRFCLAVALACPVLALAQSLGEVQVRASAADPGVNSASETTVPGAQVRETPVFRPGEILEQVPGLVVTQHAGDGKANQYFLRGVNLDHGTDFATWVVGVPVNMPSHAHGHGYTDLNFLIPELVAAVRVRKGPYHPEDGDFAAVGSARIAYVRQLEAPSARLTLGPNGYARTLFAGSPAAGAGRLVYGLELLHNDGPWQVPQQFMKANGVLRYVQGDTVDGFSVTAMAYQGRWTSTDQIPQRAIDAGLLDRFGSLDDTSGGRTHRLSLSADWSTRGDGTLTRGNAWLLRSGLDLWSNFRYCLADYALTGGCASGDQFRQAEQRSAGGFDASRSWDASVGARDIVHSVGLQARADRIAPLLLEATAARETVRTVREDRVSQASLALWAQSEVRWTPWLRTALGLRGDVQAFEVTSVPMATAGRARDATLSPRASLVLGPWSGIEVFLNRGRGFHSNDARAVTATPAASDPARSALPAQALVPALGSEIGMRITSGPDWTSTLAFWRLTSDSELLFLGDAGTTEASRPSARTGVEWTGSWRFARRWHVDADAAWTRARFTDSAAAGAFIPGAIRATASLSVRLDEAGPWSGALRVRYVGARPLNEDGSVHAPSSVLANLRVTRRIDAATRLTLDLINLANRKADDIVYWYASQLRGEASPVFDRHLHPAEPRTLRVTLIRDL